MPEAKPKESKAIAEAKRWVAALPEKQQKLYAATLADPEAAEQLGQSVLMQADYTRGIQETRAEQKKAQELHEQLVAKDKEYRTWRDTEAANVQKVLKENETLKNRNVSLASRVETLRVKYGFSEDEIKDVIKQETGEGKGAGGAAPQNLESSTTTGSESRPTKNYVDVESFETRLDNTVSLAAQFHDLQDDHRALFPDQKLKMSELVKEASAYANAHPNESVTLQSFWEQKYKVSDRRSTLEQERIDKLVEEKAEAKFKERVGEESYASLSMNGRTKGRESEGSPLLAMTRNGAFTADSEGGNAPRADGTKDPMRGVKAAIHMFDSGELTDQARGMALAGVNKP